MAELSPWLWQQFSDANGVPYSGAKVFFYEAGTSTKKDTYTTAVGDVPQSNPVILDASGKPTTGDLFLGGGSYKIVIAPSTDTDPPVSPYKTIDGVNTATGQTRDVDTIVELKALTGGEYSVINVIGYYAIGDDIDIRQYYWSAASTASDNGGSIIVPDVDDGTGRWLLKYDNVLNPTWFGAYKDGTQATITTAAINAVVTALSATGGTVSFTKGDYLVSSNIAFGDATKRIQVRFDEGASITSATGITLDFFSQIEAGLHQIFSENLVIDFNSHDLETLPEWWGAKADNSTDCTAAINAATLYSKNVRLAPGIYLTDTISMTLQGGVLLGSGDTVTTLNELSGSVVDVVSIEAWSVTIKNLKIAGGDVGIHVGAVATKVNFALIENVYTKNSVTGVKVTNGNVGRMYNSLVESATTGFHMTDETTDTNGWTVIGTRAYDCVTGFYVQGDGSFRFADDNYFQTTSEYYSGYGFRCSGARNIIFSYCESLKELGQAEEAIPPAEGNFDETPNYNYWVITGSTSIDATGTFHGISQSVSPLHYPGASQISYNAAAFDLTAGSKSFQTYGVGTTSTITNTSGAVKNLNMIGLSGFQRNNKYYFHIPVTNTGDVNFVLNEATYTFEDGSTSWYSYSPDDASPAPIMIEIMKVDTLVFSIRYLYDPFWTKENVALQVDASANLSLVRKKSGTRFDLDNASGSTKVLTLNDAASLPIGFEVIFYQNAASDSITLTLQSGSVFCDGSSTSAMGGSTCKILKKLNTTVWTIFTGI